MERNYKSDFNFILRLKRCVKHEDGTCSKEDVGWPEYDWTAVFWTSNRATTYTASCRGGVLTNCVNDGGRICVVFKNHRLSCGRLKVEFHSELPNGLYPDGIENLYEPQPLDVELVSGAGDCPTEMEVEVMLPYVKGKDAYEYAVEQGYAGSAEEFARQLAEVGDKQTRLRVSDDMELTDDGALSITERAKRSVFIDMWNEAWGEYGGYDGEATDGHPYLGNGLRMTYEEALEIYTISAGVNIDALDGNPRRVTFMGCKCRTILPLVSNTPWVNIAQLFNGSELEVIRLVKGEDIIPRGITYAAFSNCRKLRKLMPRLSYFTDAASGAFLNCDSLEDVELQLSASINFKDSPNLSLKSIEFMVKNSLNGSTPITITVHPYVYAKLTDEGNAEWYTVLTAGLDKNISFATV